MEDFNLRWQKGNSKFIINIGIYLILFVILFFGTLSSAQSSRAATYYIDSNAPNDSANGTSKTSPWKRCPGMAGFAGTYNHSNGDIFVFKGGASWKYSSGNAVIDIAYSGGNGSPDQYIVDKTWYVGNEWSHPVFDGNAAGNFIIYAQNKSNFIIDSLKLINNGELTYGSGQAIIIFGATASNIEIKNIIIDANCVNGLAYCPDAGAHFYFHDNHMKNNGRYIIGQGNNTLDDVKLYNNLIEGPGTYDPHDYHCDGFMIGADSGGLITNLYVYNNKFYGDWHSGATAAIYLNGTGNGPTAQDSIRGTWIYNNLIVPENDTCNTTFSPGAITAYNGKFTNLYIYNNTISGNVSCPSGDFDGITLVTVVSGFVENNIISNVSNAIKVDASASNITIDHNQYYNCSDRLVYDSIHNESIRTCTDFKNYFGTGPGGEQAYCNIGDPKFVRLPSGGVPGSGDWHLQLNSPAIDHGLDLSSIFTTDFDANARPQSAAWDIGAYEYVEGRDTAAPAAPSGLTVK